MKIPRAGVVVGLIMAAAWGGANAEPPAPVAEQAGDGGLAGGGGGQTPPGLENTCWRLTGLHGRAVAAGPRGEPHLVLRPERHQVSGSGGCNRLFGGYRIEAEGRIGFPALVTTRMSCPEGMDTEREFLEALAAVATWTITGTITGSELQLFDATGEPVARFAASPAGCGRGDK